jgi:hypothetical protein
VDEGSKIRRERRGMEQAELRKEEVLEADM